jgi:hypothetical protein
MNTNNNFNLNMNMNKDRNLERNLYKYTNTNQDIISQTQNIKDIKENYLLLDSKFNKFTDTIIEFSIEETYDILKVNKK